MPRYFFDLDDGTGARDEIGTDLETLETARVKAMKTLGGMVASDDKCGDGCTLVLNVRDDSNTTVLTVRLVCQVQIAANNVNRAS